MFMKKANKTPPTADSYYQQALAYYQQKRFPEALVLLNQALTINSRHSQGLTLKKQILFTLGRQYQAQSKWQQAEAMFKQALLVSPDEMNIASALAKVRQQAYLAQQVPPTQAVLAAANLAGIKNLVFQGGGIKGIAYLGALEELLTQHVPLADIRRVGGTSAGAINALLIGLGYSLAELKNLLQEIDFTTFLDGPYKEALLSLTNNLEEVKALGQQAGQQLGQLMQNYHNPIISIKAGNSLVKTVKSPSAKTIKQGFKLLTQQELGLFPGDVFREDWAEKLIQAKTGIAYATFAELDQLKQQYPEFKDIYFVGANLSTQQAEVFSYETTPNAIVSDALRISMSIPLVFKPHQLYIKENGKRVVHPAKHWYVDGGVIDNYALWLFDKERYLIPDSMQPNKAIVNFETLGFRLVDNDLKARYEQGFGIPAGSEALTGLGDYAWQLFTLLANKQESDHHKLQEKGRTLYIDHLNVQTTEFNLSQERQQSLIQSGRGAVNVYFTELVQQAQMIVNDEILITLNPAEQVYLLMSQYETEQALQLMRLRSLTSLAQDEQGHSALHVAVHNNDKAVLQKLVKAGFDIDAANQAGQTALDLALQLGFKPLVLTIVKQGGYVCQQPEQVRKLLQMAIDSGFVDSQAVTEQLAQFAQFHARPLSSNAYGLFNQPLVIDASLSSNESPAPTL